jgi:signal peptidase I
MRALRGLANVAVWALALACCAFFVAVGIGPRTGRYATMTVLSGSMTPTIPVGAVVVITPLRPSDIRVGQILTFAVPDGAGKIVSHRVVEVDHGDGRPMIRTQGDANQAPDPWLAEIDGDTAWQVRYAVPHLGLLINWLRQPLVHRISVFLFPAMLAVVCLFDIWRSEPELLLPEAPG